jgi:hypothetical protein
MSENSRSTPISRKNRRARSPAQAMVEFGLALPILLLVVYGLIETGRLIFMYASVISAARQAARYGSVTGDSGGGTAYYNDCAGIVGAAERLAFLQPFSGVDISYDNGPSPTWTSSACPITDAAHPDDGDRIRVQVSTPFDPILPFFPFDSFEITSAATRTLLVAANIKVDPSEVVLPPSSTGHLSVAKEANPTSYDTLGQVITYFYHVTNIGTDPIDTILVTDDKAGVAACPTTLAGGASFDCQITYAITQADIDNLTLTNTVTVTGLTNGVLPNIAQDSLTLNFVPRPALTLAKEGTAPLIIADGEYITYVFTLNNTGNVPLTDFAIQDATIGADWNCSAATDPLPAGGTTSCTGRYLLTNSDLAHGKVDNSATATGLFGVYVVTSNVATDSVTIPPLLLVVGGAPSPVTTLGQTITYTYSITNRTRRTAWNLRLNDTRGASNFTCGAWTFIFPSATGTCTRTYNAYTQADMDLGKIVNQASARAQGGAVSNTVINEVFVTQNIALTLTKTASVASATTLNAPITYGYSFQNTGNVTLSPPYTIADDKIANVDCSVATGTMAPGTTKSCANKLYNVTQADLNAGSIINKAKASAMFAGVQRWSNEASKTVITYSAKRLGITKSADPTYFSNVTNTITYKFKLINTGGLPLSGSFAVNDGMVPIVNCPLGPIPVGGSIECSGTYTITPADRTAHIITNTATATAENGTISSSMPSPGTATVNEFFCSAEKLRHDNPTGIPNGSDVTWTLVNETGLAVHIKSISIRWGSTPPSNLIQVLLGGSVIWPGPTNSSNGGFTVPTGTKPWTLNAGSTAMRLRFSTTAASIVVVIDFEEAGCPVVDSSNIGIP